MNRIRLFGTALVLALLVPLLSVPPAQAAAGASLTLTPTTQTVRIGSAANLAIKVDTGGQPVNAIQANLSFPGSALTCRSITVNTTSWAITAEKTCANGKIKIAVGSIQARTGTVTVATVSLRASSARTATVAFAPETAVIESVTNTDILTSTRSAVCVIKR